MAGNCNFCHAASAAAPPVDTGLLNTGAGRQAVGRALELTFDSIGPNRFDAAPSHSPSAGPSGAAHSIATRENTEEAAGSSARGFAGCTAAQPPAPHKTRGRYTRNWRTSYRSRKPSTCRHKRNSWHPSVGHSRLGSPAPVPVAAAVEG